LEQFSVLLLLSSSNLQKLLETNTAEMDPHIRLISLL